MVVKKERNKTVDAMKGLAILSVVLGHVISENQGIVADQNKLFSAIYSFHMPLFFVIAGFVLATSLPTHTQYSIWLKSKAAYLVVPSILISLLIWVISTHSVSFSSWLVQAFVQFQGEWFLWTMFLVLWLLSWCLFRSTWWLVSVVYLALLLPSIPFFGINQVQWYLLFGVLGYVVAMIGIKKWLVITGALLFIPVLVLTHWNGGWSQHSLVSLSQNPDIYLSRLAQALTGVCLLTCVAFLLRKIKLLQWFGKHSLGIYLTNFLFIGLVKGVWLSFLVSLTISIIIILILQHIQYLQRWFPRDVKKVSPLANTIS